MPYIFATVILSLLVISLLFAIKFGFLWVQAYASSADVKLLSLVGMSLRRIDPGMIVLAKIMVSQAGLSIDRYSGITTEDLETHALAGGDVLQVVKAIIVAHQANMNLDFDRAAAIDLSGRNILDAVQTSVSPRVIECPDSGDSAKTWLSAVSKDGIELRVQVRVTVRTCLDQLIGGAAEQTIIARVGQGIVSSIGSANSYVEVMSQPDKISTQVINQGLDANTAFEVVSIDIAQIDIGDNIGAQLQSVQAEADSRMARATAESRKAEAIARQSEMRASVVRFRSLVLLAESEIPGALASAIRSGQFISARNSATKTSTIKIFRRAEPN